SLPAWGHGGPGLSSAGPGEAGAPLHSDGRQDIGARPLPGSPARPVWRGGRGRGRGNRRLRRDLPSHHDHGEAFRGVPAAPGRAGGLPEPSRDAAPREGWSGFRPGNPPYAVTPRLRWLVPLAALPLLALLAYAFRTDPRAIPSPLVGRPAAAFALTTFDGKPLDLAAFRGQVVVLNFWASWCVPA